MPTVTAFALSFPLPLLEISFLVLLRRHRFPVQPRRGIAGALGSWIISRAILLEEGGTTVRLATGESSSDITVFVPFPGLTLPGFPVCV